MAEESASDPQRDSFSVPGIVAGACRFVFANRRTFLALAILPIVVIMSGNALFFASEPLLAIIPLAEIRIYTVWGIVTSIVEVVCWSVFAVSWSRFLLLGRRDTQAPVQFRLGGRDLKFTMYALLLSASAIVIGSLVMLNIKLIWSVVYLMGRMMVGMEFEVINESIEVSGNHLVDRSAISTAAKFITFLAILSRLAFIFPAIALDSFRSIRSAWRSTRRLAWRLFWAMFIAYAPYVLLDWSMARLWFATIEHTVSAKAGDWLSWLLREVPLHFIDFLFIAVVVSIICVVFRWRTGWEPPSAPSNEST